MKETRTEQRITPAPPAGVDAICDAFEAAWLAGPPPQIADFLADGDAAVGDAADRELLLRELLLADWDLRRKHGQPVELSTYMQQFAENGQLVAELWHDWQARQSDWADDAPESDLATLTNTAPLEQLGTVIDRYKLLEKLGEGGFGTVWAAEQKEPVKRRVALKIIKLGMDTKQVVARFEAERQALALMDHPNIAKVLDAGSTDAGRPYFVMELVRGIPITKYCDQEKLSIPSRLDLFMKVCHAIQHAHQKGIIHRDIKPSNILVTLHDGVPVPKVIDFGIAKATQQELTEKTIYTQLQQFIGTPAYMSPEQAEMSGLDIDTRSDIYSLGVLLYELLTGVTPFDAKELLSSGLDEMRKIIREREPQTPSSRLTKELKAKTGDSEPSAFRIPHSAIDKDLDWIVIKALEKDRTRRYETANGFAQDIKRYLNNEPVTAVAPSSAYLLKKYVRRHKSAFTTAVAIAGLLVIGATISTWLAIQATQAKRRAVEAGDEAGRERDNAQAEREIARQMAEERRLELYVAQVDLAYQAWKEGDLERAQMLLASLRPGPNQTDLRGFEWRYLWKLCQEESRDTLVTRASSDGDARLSLSADGDRLAIIDGTIVRIWDFGSGRPLPPLAPHETWASAIVFSPTNPDLLATAYGDGTIKLWDLTTHDPPSILVRAAEDRPVGERERKARHLAFSPNGRKLATANSDGYVELWDVETKTRQWAELGHRDRDNPEPALCVAFSPTNGELLATSGGDTHIRLWNAETGEQVEPPLEGHTAWVFSMVFSPDGKLLATGGWDGRVILWDVPKRTFGAELLGHRGRVASVAFSPDGESLVSGGFEDHTIRCWSVADLRQTGILRGHTESVDSLAFLPDGQSLVSSSRKTVRLWDAPPHDERNVLGDHEGWLDGVVLSPDGGLLAVPDYHHHAVKLWDVRSRSSKGKLAIPTGGHQRLAFSPDGKLLASGGSGSDGIVRLWDLSKPKEIEAINCGSGIDSVTFSSDGQILGAALHEGGLKFWNVASGREIELIRGDTHLVDRAAFSPHDGLLAVHYRDSRVGVWDTNVGREVHSFPAPRVGPMSFSSDGNLIAVAQGDASITVFDVTREEIIARLQELQGTQGIGALAFTPDSKSLAATGHDGSIKLWNIATGQVALTLRHIGPVSGVSFSDDGMLMATSGADATVQLWPAASLSEADASLQAEDD